MNSLLRVFYNIPLLSEKLHTVFVYHLQRLVLSQFYDVFVIIFVQFTRRDYIRHTSSFCILKFDHLLPYALQKLRLIENQWWLLVGNINKVVILLKKILEINFTIK